jgi:ABC-type microcin C transport system duplicated ATPase subunit YejF
MTSMAIAQLVGYPGKVSGTVKLNGRRLEEIPIHELDSLLGSKVAVVFQDPMSSLNPALKVGTQLTEAFQVHGHAKKRDAVALATSACARSCRRATVSLHRYPYELSAACGSAP